MALPPILLAALGFGGGGLFDYMQGNRDREAEKRNQATLARGLDLTDFTQDMAQSNGLNLNVTGLQNIKGMRRNTGTQRDPSTGLLAGKGYNPDGSRNNLYQRQQPMGTPQSAMMTPQQRQGAGFAEYMKLDPPGGLEMLKERLFAKPDMVNVARPGEAARMVPKSELPMYAERDYALAGDLPGTPEKKDPRQGPFQGTGMDAQTFNTIISYSRARASGQLTTPEQDMAYALAYRDASKPQILNLPDGRIIRQPGLDLTGFPQPVGFGSEPQPQQPTIPGPGSGQQPLQTGVSVPAPGGPAVAGMPSAVVIGEKRRTSTEAQLIASARGALDDIKVAESLLFTDDAIDRVDTITGKMGIPGTEGRQAYQAITRAVENLLRLKTGAQAPPQEVRELTDMYAPSPLDSTAEAQEKFKRFKSFFNETLRELGIDPQEVSESNGESPSQEDLEFTAGDYPKPQTDEDYTALESGALYIDPDDGRLYRKP